jgi:4-amino-4-deoxy-L-arabinose transferase-like glycosyltransferase
VLVVAFAAAVTMLSRLWEGDLHRDEVLYAAVAKGIYTRGEWLDLWLGSMPYHRKPPLFFWLAAGAYHALGVSVFAAKIFPALCGVGACVLVYLLARRLCDERVALVAGIVLATTPRFVRTSATFRLDPGVTFFTLLALLAYVRAVDDGRLRTWAAAGVGWGLAVMAKGAFGLTAPYYFLLWVLLVLRRPRLVVSAGFVTSVVVGALVCLPWHVYEVRHWGPGFLDTYLNEQVVDRLTGRLWPYGPSSSYFAVLVKDDWPWLAFLALGTVEGVRRAWRGDRGVAAVLLWAFGYLALLYLSQGRRARYLHQFYPQAAILTAIGLLRVLPAAWGARLPAIAWRAFAVAGFVLLVLPVPLHSADAGDVKALGPALAVLEGDRPVPTLTGFRTRSLNLRAAMLFYLDRDLRDVERLDQLGAHLVLAEPRQLPRLRAAGWTPAYTSPSLVLLRPASGA